ncbi:MAG: divalent-cation tolerance protein CutA [Rubinisphaera brasiliensis]|uniref:CutA1 divalent ion tolerance protein n=1 Tax=Rubinisphaera brasiliensis (strain ATCC 49424 / DSM 5305 / JCM 21570 / IAM 15109 / NBRC 103401 / IFAM 1448) TaxID=756272 RepID=F0SF51_RUBBR|nr:divalent-cation tolerance protein CutA [Rubinisphaera brasiliensis]ADY58206.1 CutA1 divalent ion tolerance protein [Rubinisphaera brasiliensis DSM 5305]MBR9800351.1 divalent-cation tolerance protein CutA [bacterium]
MSNASPSCRLLYCTAGSLDEAESIASTLVAERLVACANILPQMISVYQWQGKTERGDEVVLLLKTTEANTQQTIDRVVELHSYDCPAVLALPIEAGAPEFLQWIAGEVQSAD